MKFEFGFHLGSTCFFVSAILLFACHVLIDLMVIHHDLEFTNESLFGYLHLIKFIIFEDRPHFDKWHIIKMSLSALSSLCLVMAVLNLKPLNEPTRLQFFQSTPLSRAHLWTMISFYIASVLLLTAFYISPAFFHHLTLEDGFAEWLSALTWFLSSGVFLSICLTARKRLSHVVNLAALMLSSFGSVCGMEEISWFQRLLSIETPEIFEGNKQQEMNLHNFLTNPLENAFYFFVFVLFIVFPFVNERVRLIKKTAPLTLFSPDRFMTFVAIANISCNHDMWNIVFTQLSFFISIFILGYMYLNNIAGDRSSSQSFIPIFLIVFTLLIQGSYLLSENMFVRSWEITEIKELFIALCFLVYSLETRSGLANRLKEEQTSSLI